MGSEYERGERQGEVAHQLREHHDDLKALDLDIEALLTAVATLTRQVTEVAQGISRIDQAMVADKETVRQTAAALRDQAGVVSERDNARWSPFNRIVATLAAAGGIVATLYLFFH